MAIGGTDFIATAIALNLAADFWPPIKGKLIKLAKVVSRRSDEIESNLEIYKLDADIKNAVKEGCRVRLITLKKGSEGYVEFLIKVFRIFTIFASFIGLALLYCGIEDKYNILLLAPIPATISLGILGHLFFKLATWWIEYGGKRDAQNYAIGDKKTVKKLEARIKSIIQKPPERR